jgi:hypothetical protein
MPHRNDFGRQAHVNTGWIGHFIELFLASAVALNPHKLQKHHRNASQLPMQAIIIRPMNSAIVIIGAGNMRRNISHALLIGKLMLVGEP